MGNAVKFTPSGGRVRPSATQAEGGELVLAIADTALGMRPEDIPRALTPFTQIASRVARRYEGTGLGLPLVKSFVEMHGGRLHLASALEGRHHRRDLLPGLAPGRSGLGGYSAALL